MIIRGLCQNFIIRRGKIYKPRTGLKLNKKFRMDIRKQSGKSRGRHVIKEIESFVFAILSPIALTCHKGN
jgi:hypothetical protein